MLDDLEISHLYLLLKYLILDEKNITELYCLLTSPIFGYTIDDLDKKNEILQTKLFELIKDGNMKALQLFYAYRYGKPRETKDVKIINEQPLFEINYDAIVEDIIDETDE